MYILQEFKPDTRLPFLFFYLGNEQLLLTIQICNERMASLLDVYNEAQI